MRIGRLLISVRWCWLTKWIKPRYGLSVKDYTIGMYGWIDGMYTQVVKIHKNKLKVKVL